MDEHTLCEGAHHLRHHLRLHRQIGCCKHKMRGIKVYHWNSRPAGWFLISYRVLRRSLCIGRDLVACWDHSGAYACPMKTVSLVYPMVFNRAYDPVMVLCCYVLSILLLSSIYLSSSYRLGSAYMCRTLPPKTRMLHACGIDKITAARVGAPRGDGTDHRVLVL